MDVAKLTVGTKKPSALVNRFVNNNKAVLNTIESKKGARVIVKNPTTLEVGREIELKQAARAINALNNKYGASFSIVQPSRIEGLGVGLALIKPKAKANTTKQKLPTKQIIESFRPKPKKSFVSVVSGLIKKIFS